MDYVKLGRTGLEVSRLCLGCMSYGVPERGAHPWTLDEEQSRPFIRQALDARHQLLRHRQRLLGRHQRGDRRPGAASDFARRDEVVIATKVHGRDAPGPERRRAVAQGDPDRDRRQPAPARHRLRRPLPDPPLGLRARRSRRRSRRCTTWSRPARPATSARRRCTPGSSPRRCTWPTATAGRASSRCRTTTTCSTARRSARCCRCARPKGIGVIPWSPLARGRLTPRLERAPPQRTETDEFGKTLYAGDRGRRPQGRRGASARSRRARGVPRAQVALAWLLQQAGRHGADRRRDQAAPPGDAVGRPLVALSTRGGRGPRGALRASSRTRLRLTLGDTPADAGWAGGPRGTPRPACVTYEAIHRRHIGTWCEYRV